MALSARDVHDKQFKLVRQTTGYDIDEVDSFLDEVEAEISRLTQELATARQGGTASVGATAPGSSAGAGADAVADGDQVADRGAAADAGAQTGDALSAEAPALTEASLAGGATPGAAPAAATSQPTEMAARILELAQRTADQYVTEARRTADGLVGDAQAQAHSLLDDLQSQRTDLEARVARLLAIESDVRTRLTGYLEDQLRDLHTSFPGQSADRQAAPGPASQAGTPTTQEPADAESRDPQPRDPHAPGAEVTDSGAIDAEAFGSGAADREVADPAASDAEAPSGE